MMGPLFALYNLSPLVGSSNISNGTTDCQHGNHFIQEYLGQCIETTMQWSSFGVGMLSIAIFGWVMIPQIYKNQTNMKGIESISFGLLFCWCFGDTTNFAGAFMTKQGLFQEALGLWFVLVDFILVGQVVYYHLHHKKKNSVDRQLGNSTLVLCVMGLVSLSTPVGWWLTSSTAHSATDPWHLASADAPRVGRTLLSTAVAKPLTPFFNNTIEVTGYSIGVVSAIFYAGSRTAQILKNRRHKKVAGLEPFTFILCIVGNILYGAAIFLYSVEEAYLVEHLPWIVGSWGIVMMDCFVLYQINQYKDIVQDMRRQEVDVDVTDEEAPLINPAADRYGTVQ